MTPTIGRIVLYTLGEYDVEQINQRRRDGGAAANGGFAPHVGNPPAAGDVYPAMIVRTWGDAETSAVQLQVFLDGNDTYWATSRTQGDGEGCWHQPPRA